MKVFLISLCLFTAVGCTSQKIKEYYQVCKTFDYYNYEEAVPLSEEVSDEYFKDSFIGGDSRVGSLILYHKLTDAKVVSIQSLSLNMIDITKVEESDFTLLQMMKDTDKKSIYLFIGINELGMNSFDKWGSKLDEVVKSLKGANPDKDIYLIQSYTVLKAYKTATEKIQDKVNAVNTHIKEVAIKNHVYYLNPNDFLLGEDGFIKKEYVFDGIHFNQSGVDVFVSYLKSHVVGDKYVKEICN